MWSYFRLRLGNRDIVDRINNALGNKFYLVMTLHADGVFVSILREGVGTVWILISFSLPALDIFHSRQRRRSCLLVNASCAFFNFQVLA